MIRPITNRVNVIPNEVENKTVGGIVLPFEELDFKTGKVQSVGPEVKTIKAVDKVYFKSKIGVPVEVDGFKGLVMKDVDILAIER
jgi:co-chaperonin GroES (HSP10)